MRQSSIALLVVLLATGGCVHHQIALQLVDSQRVPISGVEVTLQSDGECHAIGESDSEGRTPTFTVQPDDELKLKKDGFRDTRLVVCSREIEIHRTPNPTTNPIANIVASFLLEGMIEDTVPIAEGQPVVIELKKGKGQAQLFDDSAHLVIDRMFQAKLSHDMLHSCIQIYPWKVQFPLVESNSYDVEINFP